MTCTTYDKAFAPVVIDDSSEKRSVMAALASMLRRVGMAIYESRQRQTDREITRILAQSGWRLTDSVEREMMQRLSHSNMSPRR